MPRGKNFEDRIYLGKNPQLKKKILRMCLLFLYLLKEVFKELREVCLNNKRPEGIKRLELNRDLQDHKVLLFPNIGLLLK